MQRKTQAIHAATQNSKSICPKCRKARVIKPRVNAKTAGCKFCGQQILLRQK